MNAENGVGGRCAVRKGNRDQGRSGDVPGALWGLPCDKHHRGCAGTNTIGGIAIEQEIKRTLKDFGVRPNLVGYQYIIDAVQYMLEADNFMDLGVMDVYSAVGKKHRKACTAVERGIRLTVERMHNTCEPDTIASIFGRSTKMNTGKLTNKEFLWTLAEYFADASKAMKGMEDGKAAQ